MSKRKPPDNSALAASPEWLFRQAKDYYQFSTHADTPGRRAWNRKRFIATMKDLLKRVSAEEVIKAWGGPNGWGLPADARAIIDELAGEPAKPCQSSPAGHSALPAADLNEITKHLAAALESLHKAVGLITGAT